MLKRLVVIILGILFTILVFVSTSESRYKVGYGFFNTNRFEIPANGEGDALLLENGDYLLLENGDKLLLE